MKNLLFVHGAWHNEKCWEQVINRLSNEEIVCHTVTIAGNSPDATGIVGYEDMIASLVAAAEKIDGSFILIAHSSAGHIVQHGAPQFAEKIERIIFNNAWLLPDNTSQFDLVGDENLKNGMRAAADAHPRKCIPVDEGFLRHGLAQDAEKEIQDTLLALLVPQPIAIMETKADVKAFQSLDVPMSMLYCVKDISLPEGAYIGMFLEHSSGSEKDIVEIDGAHETLFVNPDLFVEGLRKLL